ncbi:MAG: TusE/DsrC/DsvC family sulfur relay protein [Candidatus Zixiibacteriota bacterium]
MGTITFGDKTYTVDTEDFLADYSEWDENFARGMAPKVGIISGLSEDHWKIINFIRDTFKNTGKCPLVYETCRKNRLHLHELKRLFPAGYLRGACKLTGITYKDGYLDQAGLEDFAEKVTSPRQEKSYEIDRRGFLVNPSEWDEEFVNLKVYELKMPTLSEKHWQIIRFLRERFEQNNVVPTVYETCEENELGLDELEELFPDGYHRGAVKIAGLRVR